MAIAGRGYHALVAAFLVSAGSAMAATGSAGITNLQYVATSLDTGVIESGGYVFLPGEGTSAVAVNLIATGTGTVIGSDGIDQPGWLQPSSLNPMIDGTSSTAALTAGGATVSGEDSTPNTILAIGANSETYTTVPTTTGSLIVAPHTQLLITGSAFVSGTIDQVGCYTGGCQLLSGLAEFEVVNRYGDLGGTELELSLGPDPGTQSGSHSDDFSVTITNNSDLWLGNAVIVQVSVEDILLPAGVPEPSDYALMLAGLGMLSLVARRRSVRARA